MCDYSHDAHVDAANVDAGVSCCLQAIARLPPFKAKLPTGPKDNVRYDTKFTGAAEGVTNIRHCAADRRLDMPLPPVCGTSARRPPSDPRRVIYQ